MLYFCGVVFKNIVMFKILNTVKNITTMQKSEMRLVLFLLQDKTSISKTYRQMAKETGLSLGSVQGVMSDLAERGFVVETSAGRILRKRMFLIDRWARDYSEGRKRNS